ncbi:universal stress protein [Proteobacteria bacterium 005FR1]|nr:universal stress protein [Proteobacteria bacterium 005FR1]
MTTFSSILLPLDGSDNAVQPLRTAAWIAGQLNSRLHLVTATREPESPANALERLKVPTELRSRVVLHQQLSYAEAAILQTMEELHTDLLVISARGEGGAASASELRVGHVVRAVLEQTNVPVLLAPPNFVERLPMRSALVPVSGEQETDEALGLAVQVADCLQLRLNVAHVVSPDIGEADYTSELQYSDAAHHEFAGRLHDLLLRASHRCSPEDIDRVVENVCLCRGKVLDELLRMAERTAADLLIIGWHGKLAEGRAELIKQFIGELTCPILLTRSRPAAYFHLNVGEELE